MNHTPGPWEIKRNQKTKLLFVGQYPLATVYKEGDFACDDIHYANARLIATAPEMLEMLKAAYTYIGEAKIDGEMENCNILAEMFHLINRAEGKDHD